MELAKLENLQKENVIFNPAKANTVKNSKIKYEHIKIETIYPNGKKSALVVETPSLFSFGVNERITRKQIS